VIVTAVDVAIAVDVIVSLIGETVLGDTMMLESVSGAGGVLVEETIVTERDCDVGTDVAEGTTILGAADDREILETGTDTGMN